mmetsp:Transcript_19260/g.40620  ORF Transcript_19260/g.40620 Transcript_19260/m.40620 type:complete len:109 (-) Transcript_19260:116-442(-)
MRWLRIRSILFSPAEVLAGSILLCVFIHPRLGTFCEVFVLARDDKLLGLAGAKSTLIDLRQSSFISFPFRKLSSSRRIRSISRLDPVVTNVIVLSVCLSYLGMIQAVT